MRPREKTIAKSENISVVNGYSHCAAGIIGKCNSSVQIEGASNSGTVNGPVTDDIMNTNAYRPYKSKKNPLTATKRL